MATHQKQNSNVQSFRKRKIETTYEYVPIIGEILGYWRKVNSMRIGEEFEIHIDTPLNEYDRVIINGQEITIPDNEK